MLCARKPTVANSFDIQIADFLEQGIEIHQENDLLELAVPLNVAYFNPQLAYSLGVGRIALGLAGEPQYKNDEQIDNQLRSVLFQLPNPDIAEPDRCLDGALLSECFRLASDLGSLDVFRARDHGIAMYNDLREAYGLDKVTYFSDLTGETTEDFPENDSAIDQADPLNDPAIMDFVELQDSAGNLIALDSESAESDAVTGVRRTALAARLKAIYGDVNQVDSFVGMISEPHLSGSEFGALQNAIWQRQFEALRDGDSNHYLWSKGLRHVMRKYGRHGLEYRQTLADVIVNNSDIDREEVRHNMFLSAE